MGEDHIWQYSGLTIGSALIDNSSRTLETICGVGDRIQVRYLHGRCLTHYTISLTSPFSDFGHILLCSEITPGGARGIIYFSGIDHQLVTYKASALLPVLALLKLLLLLVI